jgi:hypothetical protein
LAPHVRIDVLLSQLTKSLEGIVQSMSENLYLILIVTQLFAQGVDDLILVAVSRVELEILELVFDCFPELCVIDCGK